MTDDYPTPDVPVESMEPPALRETLEAGDPLTVLDVRSSSEYETWHIEGDNVTVANVPYFDFIEGVTDDLLAEVPDGDPVVTVCAKGGASEYVAGLLLEHGIEAVNLAGGMNEWAREYVATEVTRAPGPATVLQYRRPSSGCLSYLVVEGGAAAVVDPLAAFADRYVEDARARGADLTYAVDTHIHADHLSGVRDLVREAGVTGVIPAEAVPRGVEYDVEYETVADGDVFDVGSTTLRAIHTPGHTSGMTSYLVDDGVLLTGDGLFTESVARPDLEKGDEGAPAAARQLYQTLHERVLSLPANTVVAPGHYSDAATPAADGTYTAPLGDLADQIDVLEMAEDGFVEFILADMPPRPANHETIIATNLGHHEPTEEEAFELELGPNNCAATRTAMTGD